jgi:hypothetical protein
MSIQIKFDRDDIILVIKKLKKYKFKNKHDWLDKFIPKILF